MTNLSQIMYHVYPGPHRITGIRSYAQLLERILTRHVPELAIETIDLNADWWSTIPLHARVLVQIGRNEGEMHWFLREAAKRRPDLKRYILIHDPPDFSIEKHPWMRRIGSSRWGRAVRRGVNAILGDAMDRVLIQDGDVFLAMSECGCQAISRRMEEMGARSVIALPVPLGLYLDSVEGATECRDTSDILHVGFFGYISPSKGIDVLLDAARILLAQDKYRNRIHFTIAGNPDSEHSEAVLKDQMRKIRAEGLAERFEFLPGPSDQDLPSLLGKFDLLALPYLRPGSYSASGPLHWAWTVGIPAIANANPYFNECLGGSGAGLVVAHSTGEAWATALAAVLDDSDLLASLRMNALEQRRRNSWQNVAHSYLGAFGRAA